MSDQNAYFTRHLIEDSLGRGWLDYRLAPGGTVEIVNIEVGSDYRRQGVGRMLLELLIQELPAARPLTLYAFTTDVNKIAQEWYEAMKFELHKLQDFYAVLNEGAYCCVRVIR